MPVDYLQKPIFRMVHFDNLEYVLRNGMCTRNHTLADPDYINIGDSDLISQRQEYPAKIVPPGGNLGDYVPFYFGGALSDVVKYQDRIPGNQAKASGGYRFCRLFDRQYH